MMADDARSENDNRSNVEAERDEAAADRDALLRALGWRTGPLGATVDRKIILEDARDLRPALIKARSDLQKWRDDAELWQLFVAEGYVSGLLVKVWRQRKEARRAFRQLADRATTAARGQVEYWHQRQKSGKHLEDAIDEDGEYSPIGDDPAWSSGYCNGRYSEADWWLSTLAGIIAETGKKG